MTAPKWTPDLSSTNGHCGFAIYSQNDGMVCTVYADIISTEWPMSDGAKRPENTKSVANAHLIAAAPELYEALESLVGQIDGACGDVLPAGAFSLARKKAHAALANALGEI